MEQHAADRRFSLVCSWLEALVVLSGVLGGVLVLLPRTALFTAYNATYARAFWGQEVLSGPALEQHAFTMGVSGVGVCGWAVTLWFVVRGPFRARQRWAFSAVAYAVALWAGLDVVLAVVAGVWGEAWFAAAAGVGFGVPLLLAFPAFRRGVTAG